MPRYQGPNQMQDFESEYEPERYTAGPNAPADPSNQGESVDMRLFGNYMQDVPENIQIPEYPTGQPTYTPPVIPDVTEGPITAGIAQEVREESQGYTPTGNIYNPGYTGPDGSNSGQFDQGSTLGSLNDSDVYLGSHTGNSENPAQDATNPTTTEAAEEAARLTQQRKARNVQQQMADGSMEYLEANNLLNQHISEDVYQTEEYTDPEGNKAIRPKVDPLTGDPLLKPELQADPFEAARTEVSPVSTATTSNAGSSGDVTAAASSATNVAVGENTFSSAASAEAFLAQFTEGTAVTAADHANIKAAKDVIARDFEASLIPISEVGNSLDKLRDIEPMKAASVAANMNELLSELESGNVPLWARPAVTKVEQSLAGRGVGASSIGRDSLFNAIISAAMPIAQSDANLEQDSNKTNYNSKVQALFNDEAQIFAARQFNATSINQTNQFISNLKAQVDMNNAARKDNMAQFNSSQRNQISLFNTQQLNDMEKLNTSERNAIARSNAQMQTNVSVSNAQMNTQVNMANAEMSGRFAMADADAANRMALANADRATQVSMSNRDSADRLSMSNADRATQVAMSNASMSNQLAQHQATLDANREQFNTQSANAIAQADVSWRRNLNTAETAAINAANQANVSNAFNLNNQAQQNLWQESRDKAHWAETATENEIARQHEGAMRLLVADIETAAAEGAAGSNSAWDKAKDAIITQGIDYSIDWFVNTNTND